jgi:galactose mutarotase-like enzyme
MIEVKLDQDHGAEILFVGTPGGRNVLFHDPSSSPLRADRSGTYGTSEADWKSEYRGGWQELFPNAGAECEVWGVTLPFHGEVSRAKWETVESDERSAVLRSPARLPLVLERRMTLVPDRPVLQLEETVRNESDLEVPYLWGHHPAFVAARGTMIDLPSAQAQVAEGFDPPINDLEVGSRGEWPLVAGKSGRPIDLRQVPDGATERVVFLSGLSDGWAALRHPIEGFGVAMSWDIGTFPDVWMWTEIGGTDFPFYGRSRIIAIEPATACPSDGLAHAIARGRARRLSAGASHHTWLTVSLFEADEEPVAGVDRGGSIRSGGREG